MSKTGKQSLKLSVKGGEEACLVQKVSVKPATRYLLAAWLKTKDVQLKDGGEIGGQLAILDGEQQQQTGSIAGTQDWTFASCEFNSEDRKEVEVAIRLGSGGSVASGTAWYDGVSLVEIPAKN
jgi:hypothetical protein